MPVGCVDIGVSGSAVVAVGEWGGVAAADGGASVGSSTDVGCGADSDGGVDGVAVKLLFVVMLMLMLIVFGTGYLPLLDVMWMMWLICVFDQMIVIKLLFYDN